MKTEYPPWFHANYPHVYKPTPPPEKVWEYKPVSTLNTDQYSYFDIGEFPADANCLTVEVEKDWYDNSVNGIKIIFAHKHEVPNPRYKEQLAHYEEALADYKVRHKEWKHWKKIWDEEHTTKQKEDRRKMYKELKKEFEDE